MIEIRDFLVFIFWGRSQCYQYYDKLSFAFSFKSNYLCPVDDELEKCLKICFPPNVKSLYEFPFVLICLRKGSRLTNCYSSLAQG